MECHTNACQVTIYYFGMKTWLHNLKAHNRITGEQGGRLTASMVRIVRVIVCI